MKVKKFSRWKIFPRIITIVAVIILLNTIMFLFYFLPTVKEKLYDDKKVILKDVVDVGYSILDYYNNKVKSGTMTIQEAQAKSAEALLAVRFHQGEYYFVHNVNCVTIVHGNPNQIGKEMSKVKDTKGKLFVLETVEVCQKYGSGYVDYYWKKKDATEASQKFTYVRVFLTTGVG